MNNTNEQDFSFINTAVNSHIIVHCQSCGDEMVRSNKRKKVTCPVCRSKRQKERLDSRKQRNPQLAKTFVKKVRK